jgi:UDP-glucuronate decarboxylase
VGVRILVTGGAGFIGSHLCARLLDEGNEVTCLDNLSTGAEENIDRLRTSPRFRLIHKDVCEAIDLGADRVYHLACPASPIHYRRDRVTTTLTNAVGTDSVLRLARKTGGRVLLASTSEIYGDPLVCPQQESYWGNVNPNGPRSCYDEGKRVAESLMVSYHEQHGVDIRIARIFNTYGPGMDVEDGRAVPNFIVQAVSGRPLTVYGDGGQTRSFCYVSDMVEGLIRLMESAGYTGPVNLGNPDERSIVETARLIKTMVGGDSPIVFTELPSDDPKMRCPDIAKARRELGWQPTVPLEDGLGETIAYFRTKILPG